MNTLMSYSRTILPTSYFAKLCSVSETSWSILHWIPLTTSEKMHKGSARKAVSVENEFLNIALRYAKVGHLAPLQ